MYHFKDTVTWALTHEPFVWPKAAFYYFTTPYTRQIQKRKTKYLK